MNNTIFPSVPNQRHVTTHKKKYKSGEFTCIGIQENLEAAKNLSYSEYMLYMWFCLNANNYELWVSPADITRKTALSLNTFHTAFKGLIAKGYLVKRADAGTFYDFYETPKDGTRVPLAGTPYTENQYTLSQKTVENTNIINNKNTALAQNAQSSVSTIETSDETIFFDY